MSRYTQQKNVKIIAREFDFLETYCKLVSRLAFTPCLVEASVVAISSHLLLGFPRLWGFMLGFILAAVSPAVVVPCLLTLQERGFGVDKVGIDVRRFTKGGGYKAY